LVVTETGSGYANQTFIVKPGYKLYFVEKSRGDDVGGVDANFGDDKGVLVDLNGYVVK